MLQNTILEPGTQTASGWAPLPPQPDGVKTLYTKMDRYPDGQIKRITQYDGTLSFYMPNKLRSATYTYDSNEGIFPKTITNPFGYSTQYVYHAGLGVLFKKI